MADPKNKYAGLPGIASADEKDVYETDDLPEADQEELLDEAESEHIERPHLNARSAHERFRGKGLLPGPGLDFSDAARRRPHVGYLAVSGDWEIAAEGEPETLLQRRNRLQADFQQLVSDLNQLKTAGNDNKDDAQLVVSLVPELESTLKQLNQMQVPDGASDLTATPGQHVQNIQKLIKELNEVEKKKAVGAGGAKVAGGEAVITYQMNTFPAHAHLVRSSRLTDLEARLKQLETVLGNTPDNLSRLQLSEVKSLQEGVSELSARTNLLDLNTIDAIDHKLSSLLGKMDAVVEKRGGPGQFEIEAKVNQLYDSYKKVEALSQSLLPIADRLAALSSLHLQAGEFKKTLSQLKVEISSLTSKLALNQATAEAVRSEMPNLLSTVTENIAHLNARLAALQK